MNEPLRVLLFKGVCNYDHIRSFTDYLHAAFDQAGAITVLHDLGRGAPVGPVREGLARFDADVAFSFNGDGVDLGLARHTVTWMVDEPYYHPQWQATLRTPELKTFWTNRESRAHAATMGLAREPVHLDLAGRALPRVRPEAKDIDVLFVGSITDPETMRRLWAERCGAMVSKMMNILVERWAPDPSGAPIRDVFAALARESGVYGHPGLAKLEPFILGEVNRYVRTRKRLDTVRALSDLPLTLVGDGWRALVEGPRVTYRTSMPFHLTEELASRAKVALTVQPVHAHGASERFFTAMANEAVLVVNDNRWLAEHYEPNVDYLPFSIAAPEQARAHVERVLSDDDAREAMTERARARTLGAHTWAHRAEALLSAFAEMRRPRRARRAERRRGAAASRHA